MVGFGRLCSDVASKLSGLGGVNRRDYRCRNCRGIPGFLRKKERGDGLGFVNLEISGRPKRPNDSPFKQRKVGVLGATWQPSRSHHVVLRVGQWRTARERKTRISTHSAARFSHHAPYTQHNYQYKTGLQGYCWSQKLPFAFRDGEPEDGSGAS